MDEVRCLVVTWPVLSPVSQAEQRKQSVCTNFMAPAQVVSLNAIRDYRRENHMLNSGALGRDVVGTAAKGWWCYCVGGASSAEILPSYDYHQIAVDANVIRTTPRVRRRTLLRRMLFKDC